MDCLAKTKKFKNKHPVWSDGDDVESRSQNLEDEIADEKPELDPVTHHEVSSQHSSSDSSEDEEDNFDMLASDIRSKKITLETKELRYKHLVNINNELSYKGGLNVVQFHPKSKIALTASRFGQADLFEIDGERNRYLQNIKLPFTKEPCCAFKPSGDTIVISSKAYRGGFFTYNMISSEVSKHELRVGKDRKEIDDFTLSTDLMACRSDDNLDVHVLSSKTYENNFSLKLNEPAKIIRFNAKTNEIIVAGKNAQVYIWDLRKTSTCKHKFTDEGTVHITSMDLNETSNLLSIGSDSGIMNTYELSDCMSQRNPIPIKTFSNLTTEIDILKFNTSGELLLVGSSLVSSGFRLIHTHSGIVYKNFPLPGKDYKHLLAADFSPLSGYLGLGCSSGRAHLCRIPYYKSY